MRECNGKWNSWLEDLTWFYLMLFLLLYVFYRNIGLERSSWFHCGFWVGEISGFVLWWENVGKRKKVEVFIRTSRRILDSLFSSLKTCREGKCGEVAYKLVDKFWFCVVGTNFFFSPRIGYAVLDVHLHCLCALLLPPHFRLTWIKIFLKKCVIPCVY